MKKIGVAIVGTGAIAHMHIDAYKQFSQRCEIRVLCNKPIEVAEKVKTDNELLNADVIDDWKDIVNREDIDLVSLCLPPGMHADAAIDLLKAGKHVLVEKPMALSLSECDKMIQAARDHGALLSVVSQNRYKIPTMKVKQLIDEKASGRVLFTTANSLWWRGENYYDLWWRGRWVNEGGGCMMSHAIHHVDLLQWMLGMPEKITAIVSNYAHSNSECEDAAIAILQYPDMMAQLTATLLSHGEEQEMIFQTEKARLSIPWDPEASKPLGNGFPEQDREFLQKIQDKYQTMKELELEGHPAQIKNFLDAIDGKDTLLIDGNEGRKAIELIMAVYKSAYSGQTVTLPIPSDDAFYDLERFAEVMPHFNEKTVSKDSFAENKITLGRNVGK